EIRISKSETNSNDQNSKSRPARRASDFEFRICFGFRYSDFGCEARLHECLQLKLAQGPREFAADDPGLIGMMLDAHGAEEEGARKRVFAPMQEDDKCGAALEAPLRQQTQAGA